MTDEHTHWFCYVYGQC